MSSVNSGITRYFLRIYAIQLARTGRPSGLRPFAEAVVQTVFILVIPMVAACAAAIVLLATSREHYRWLMEYRFAVTACVATFPLLLAFMLVRGACLAL